MTQPPSGRKLYRHSSNAGSVIEFDYWGSSMKLFVADAKYRGLAAYDDTTSQMHGNPMIAVTHDYFNGSADIKTEALTYNKDDAWIQSTYTDLRNDGTAKSNTDTLMKYSTTAAAHHCRNQDIPGVGQLDLPNLYELIILYLESDNIDALDPTAESNRDKALGKINPCGRFDFNNTRSVWSSTESGAMYYKAAWHVYDNGRAYNYSYQTTVYGVAPVKELDA